MAHITHAGLQACLAFGAAALAVAEVAELVGDGCRREPPAYCSPSSRPHTTDSGSCSTSERTRPCMPWG